MKHIYCIFFLLVWGCNSSHSPTETNFDSQPSSVVTRSTDITSTGSALPVGSTYTASSGAIFTKVQTPGGGWGWKSPDGDIWTQNLGKFSNIGQTVDVFNCGSQEYSDQTLENSDATNECESQGAQLPFGIQFVFLIDHLQADVSNGQLVTNWIRDLDFLMPGASTDAYWTHDLWHYDSGGVKPLLEIPGANLGIAPTDDFSASHSVVCVYSSILKAIQKPNYTNFLNKLPLISPDLNYSLLLSVPVLDKFIIAGIFTSNTDPLIHGAFIARFNSDGSLDPTFAKTGYTFDSSNSHIRIDSISRIIYRPSKGTISLYNNKGDQFVYDEQTGSFSSLIFNPGWQTSEPMKGFCYY